MRFLPRALALPLLVFGAACADTTSPDPDDAGGSPAGAVRTDRGGADRLVLMTQNLYVGADVDAVLLALQTPDPGDDFQSLLAAIEMLTRTDFPARAAALAEAIARYRPHAVGLQEVSIIRIELPPFGLDVEIPFLPILMQTLEDRGLPYAVADTIRNIDALPPVDAVPGGVIQLVDYDALLVDTSRVTVNAAFGRNFTANIGDFAEGVALIRGWVQANVTVGGREYTIATTHPESDLSTFSFEQLRAAQVAEIVAELGGASPAVILGDLNDDPGTLMYQVLTGAGFTDLWRELRPGVVGLTCCHEKDLSDRVPRFSERIDYVFTRGFGHGNREALGQVKRIGMRPSDRVDGQLGKIWVSDHAGLVAELLLPPGPKR